jgi:hypothetical protein
MTHLSPSSGSTQSIVIIKAAPQTGQRHGETVCCAGVDLYRNWLRLYPVSFRTLEKAQKFGRWNRLNYNWRRPKALAYMHRVFGEEYPRNGMLLAMGTHSLCPDTWLINGIVRIDEDRQQVLF